MNSKWRENEIMKRICFVVYDIRVLGGAEQVAVNLANELCKVYSVQIYSICGKKRDIPYFVNEKIEIVYGQNEKLRIRQLITKNFGKFSKYVRKNKINVVYMIGAYAGALSVLTQFMTNAKYVFCDHGALMNQWKEKDITRLRKVASKLSDRTVVLTDKTKEDYMEYFHLSSEKVLRIYNWIEPKLLERGLHYDVESKKILTVGRISSEKGYDLLVNVAEKILPEFPDWTWDIYGDGEEFDKIKELINKKNLQNQLILKGRVQNVNRIFNNYAFYVLTSYREGLPLVLLEAKASGLPMISFDIETGPKEIIDPQNGVLIPPYDCEAMADAMKMLMSDCTIRKNMSEGTRMNIELFEQKNILEQWIKLTDKLCEY